jgi:hypothetical protein
MHQDLQLAGLSERAHEAYFRAVRQLADHFHTSPDHLSEQQVREYFLHLKNDRKFADASMAIADSGIQFLWPVVRADRLLVNDDASAMACPDRLPEVPKASRRHTRAL